MYTKQELIEYSAARSLLPKKTQERAIDAFLSCLFTAFGYDESVRIKGLGTLSVTKKKAKRVRHPKTGEWINVPERKTISFKPSGKLLEMINDD